jgi:membrane dipeptidase
VQKILLHCKTWTHQHLLQFDFPSIRLPVIDFTVYHCWRDFMKHSMQTRRDFLQKASLMTALYPLGSLRAKERAKPRIPFVDGLCISIPDAEDADFPASGLSALLADISAVSQLKTTDGSIRYTRTYEACLRSIVETRQKLRKSKNAFLATRGSEIRAAFKSGKTAVFLQFQGCEPIGEELSRIDLFYELGLRVLQITHHNNNLFGGGCIEKNWTGLTKFGAEGIEKMNALGMIPDLSHASHLTALDVLKASKKPVILSHGACRAIVNNARCTPDEVIRGIADSGGAMGIFMMSFWLTTDAEPTIDALIKQLLHVIKIGGIGAAGIANDYTLRGEMELAKLNNNNATGIKNYLGWWDSVAKQGVLGFDKRPTHVIIPELNNIERMFTIHAALEKNGFKAAEIEKIMGGNWIRVLTESLG